jgi:hypothetical protein
MGAGGGFVGAGPGVPYVDGPETGVPLEGGPEAEPTGAMPSTPLAAVWDDAGDNPVRKAKGDHAANAPLGMMYPTPTISAISTTTPAKILSPVLRTPTPLIHDFQLS